MDWDIGKEGGGKIQKLILALIISAVVGVCPIITPAFAADEQQHGETKIEIELEKQAIVVKIERPSIVFPIRWKNPDFPEEREYLLKQDFRDEIRKLTGVEL